MVSYISVSYTISKAHGSTIYSFNFPMVLVENMNIKEISSRFRDLMRKSHDELQ